MTEGLGSVGVSWILIWGWDEGGILAKRHDGCEIQLLEGEETHTLPSGRAPLKYDGYNYTVNIRRCCTGLLTMSDLRHHTDKLTSERKMRD